MKKKCACLSVLSFFSPEACPSCPAPAIQLPSPQLPARRLGPDYEVEKADAAARPEAPSPSLLTTEENVKTTSLDGWVHLFT